jgi:Homeodomain-like domain/Transposase IS116/IS110/IS902 family
MTLARQGKGCERLMSVPGIGPIISSAMVAAIGSGDAFAKGRDFGAWLVKKQGAFVLRARDRTGLEGILRNGNVPQKIVKRAKIVLMTADVAGVMTIMRAVGVSKTTVWRWQDYFVEAGVTGIFINGQNTMSLWPSATWGAERPFSPKGLIDFVVFWFMSVNVNPTNLVGLSYN